MKSRSSMRLGELLVSIGLTTLGLIVILSTGDISSVGGYSQIGPRVFPYLTGAGLVLFGGLLCWQAVRGGWRNGPAREGEGQADWLAFGLLSLGILLHMASVAWAGFILASTFLFTLIARAFGSTRLLRDVIVGLVLSAAAYFVFTEGLGLNLPAGLLGGI